MRPAILRIEASGDMPVTQPCRPNLSRASDTAQESSRISRATISSWTVPIDASGHEIAEAAEVLFLLLVARRQLVQARGVAAEDVVLGLLREERQVPDRRRQVEIPMRIVGGVEELRFRIDHAEGA